MPTQTKLPAKIASVVLLAALALTGCGHKDDAAIKTSTQIQQTAQQQAAQRAAYFNSHPMAGGQNPAVNPAYRGHP